MATDPIQLTNLSKYLEVARLKYDACMSRIDLPLRLDGENAVVRFKHVKFDRKNLGSNLKNLGSNLDYYNKA